MISNQPGTGRVVGSRKNPFAARPSRPGRPFPYPSLANGVDFTTAGWVATGVWLLKNGHTRFYGWGDGTFLTAVYYSDNTQNINPPIPHGGFFFNAVVRAELILVVQS